MSTDPNDETQVNHHSEVRGKSNPEKTIAFSGSGQTAPTKAFPVGDSNLSVQQRLDKIVEEFVQGLRNGEQPSIDDYRNGNSDIAAELDEVLSSVAMIEDLKRSGDTRASTSGRFENVELERIGDYRIIEEVGRGGMGIVLKAVYESLGRTVAIKVLPPHAFQKQETLARFKKEARAAANLHHSNIVNVFGVGEFDGLHYYVMEYVDGVPLSSVISEWNRSRKKDVKQNGGQYSSSRSATSDSLSIVPQFASDPERIRWSAELISTISDALHYSHQQKILHRDIKPANLLVDDTQKPWITDFGLVKEITSQTLTKAGDLLGTPQYMAPESLEGKYDQRSEVYCIGLTLYELIAKQPVFSHSSPTQIFKMVASSTPMQLRQIEPAVPRDLETIVHKAIERNPSLRYQTAAALRDDLFRFLQDRPILARRVSPIEKSYRWCRRNPIVASLASLSALLLLAVAVVSSSAYFTTQAAYGRLDDKHNALIDQQKKTDAARMRADKNAEQAKKNEAEMRIEFSRADGNVNLAIEAFDELFRRIMAKGAGRDLKSNMEMEAFSDLSSLGTLVTKDDAKILESVIKFYDQFTRTNEGNEKLKVEIAKAYRRIANIYHLTGELNKAEEGYQKTCRTYARIVKQNRDDIENVVNLAECHNELATTLRKNNKLILSISEHRTAIRLLQDVAYQQIDSCQYVLATTLISLGTFGDGGLDNVADNTTNRTQREANLRRINQPNNRNRMPLSLSRIKNWEMIAKYRENQLRRAEQIAESLYKKETKNTKYRLLRAQVYRSKAVAVGVNGERRWQAAQLRQSIAELEKLQNDFPENPLYQFVLAQTLAIPVQNADDNTVIKMKTKGAKICNSLMNDFPLVIEYVDLAATINEQLARLYLKNDEAISQAKESFQLTQKLLLELIQQVPRIKNYSLRYAAVSSSLCDLLIREKVTPVAERELRSLIAFLQSPQFPRGSKKLVMLELCRKRLSKIRNRM